MDLSFKFVVIYLVSIKMLIMLFANKNKNFSINKMVRAGININLPPQPKIVAKNVIKKPKTILASQLKGAVTIGKTTYFGFTPAQIQKKEQEKINKNLKNLNLKN